MGFLYHVFVGHESLNVRYCFLSKAWRDRGRLTLYDLDLHALVGSTASGAEIHFNIILSTIL